MTPEVQALSAGLDMVHAAMTTAPIRPILTEEERRRLWLEDRKTAITGTDVAAILGLSRFSSPIQVYLDKKGLSETTENEAMRWGRRLERPILEAYADTQGVGITFADPYTLRRVPGFTLLGASLDAIREDGAPVDAKNTRMRTGDWGESGTDIIPVYYATQLTVQMMVTDAPFADLAVLFSGQEFATFRLYRDLENEAIIRERVAVWWERHIVQDVPPDPDGSESSSRYLAGRYSRASGLVKAATPEVMELAQRRNELDASIKSLEAQKKEAENRIRAYMGEAMAIPGLCTWKNNKDSEVTDWEALAKACNRPDLIPQFTTTKPGARVLRFTAR
jgi:putative phage-type endonuclease